CVAASQVDADLVQVGDAAQDLGGVRPFGRGHVLELGQVPVAVELLEVAVDVQVQQVVSAQHLDLGLLQQQLLAEVGQVHAVGHRGLAFGVVDQVGGGGEGAHAGLQQQL